MTFRPRQTSLLRATLGALAEYPFAIFLLQFPGGVMELIGRYLEMRFEEGMALAAILFFPYGIATAFCTALTYAFLASHESGATAPLSLTYKEVGGKWKQLVPVTFLAGLLCLVGMVALILPAIYFMTLFFFFPQLIISEPRLPWSVYLSRSKRIAKRAFVPTLIAVVFFFLLELGVEKAGDLLGSRAAKITDPAMARTAILLAVQTLLYMVMSATINVWASYFYMKLKAEPSHETASGTA